MPHITVAEAQAFLETTKCRLPSLEEVLEEEQSNYVLSRLSATYNSPSFGVSSWTDETNTPELVRQAIAMLYAGWFYDRQYAEVISEAQSKSYGAMLRDCANKLCEGIASGSIQLIEISPNVPAASAVYYPTDVSSTTDAALSNTNRDDLSLGPAKFTMGKVF